MTVSSLPALAAVAMGTVTLMACAPSQGQPPAFDKDSVVKATLIADTTAITPGKTFKLGVLFKAQPDWHIYWKHPGASGFATTVQWGLPPGASQSETLYPAPIMFESPGPVVSFGYENETLLITEAKATELPSNGKVQITAKAKWLMCSDRCIPNSKELTLSLPVGEGKPDNAEIFDKYVKLVPTKAADLPEGVAVKTATSGSSTTFTVTITPPEGKTLVAEGHGKLHPAYFFPNPQKGYVSDPPSVAGKIIDTGGLKVYDGPAVITYSTEPEENSMAPSRKVSGTLVFQTVTGTTADKPVLVEVERVGE